MHEKRRSAFWNTSRPARSFSSRMILRMSIEKWLISRGWAKSPGEAQALIAASRVYRNGLSIEKTTTLISLSDEIYVQDPAATHYVSRGGDKIASAFSAFQETVDLQWYVDVGAS